MTYSNLPATVFERWATVAVAVGEREREGGRAREKYETKRRTRVNAHRPGYRFLILRAISPVITRAN